MDLKKKTSDIFPPAFQFMVVKYASFVVCDVLQYMANMLFRMQTANASWGQFPIHYGIDSLFV